MAGFQRWLVVAAVISPVLVFSSFPACFLLGGLMLTQLPAVWRSRRPVTWVHFGVWGLALGCAFVLLYCTAIQAQKNERMLACWETKLPQWDKPYLVPFIALVRLTEVARYALEPVGNAFCVFAAVGAMSLWRAGRGWPIGLLLAPIALNTVGWLLSSYPLEASRVVVYAAPAVLLLIAAGIPPALAWVGRMGKMAPFCLAVVLLAPVGQVFWVVIHPWQRLDSRTPVAFVLEHRKPDEPVVGTFWEQAYYCRNLGPYYRAMLVLPTEPASLLPGAALASDGTPSGECVDTLWLLSNPHGDSQNILVSQLQPPGPWRIVERYPFRDVIVLKVCR